LLLFLSFEDIDSYAKESTLMRNDDRNKNDRNQTDKESEPNRSIPGDRKGGAAGYPGGYGPAQGQIEKPGRTSEPEKVGNLEPSREH